MYKVEAIIRDEKLQCVKQGLNEAGFSALTVTEVRGRGQQKGSVIQWLGGYYYSDLMGKLKLEVVVNREEDVQKVIDLVCNNAYTGEVGDGKIFVYPLNEVVRIRTREKGETAV
ncbi:MAG: P-II family nitrogen regulator [Candidatus Altiarchaeota archaeon]|nr:P-II family nitrogen regulator [Candidatus Altiarchaeota archaeon]